MEDKKDLVITSEELATLLNDAVAKGIAPMEEELKRKVLSNEVTKEVKDLVGIEKAAKWLQAIAMGDYNTVKALSEGVGADGGYIVPTEFRAIVIEKLQKAAVIRPYAQVIPMGRNKLEVPVEGSAVTASWKGENVDLDETNPDFGQIVLDTNKLTGLSIMSRELLADTPINLVNYIAGRFANAFAQAEDKAFMTGAGTTEPKGLRQYTVGGGDQLGADLTGDDLITLFYGLPAQYRKNSVWLMHNNIIALCRKLKDGVLGRYLWTDGLGDAPATILGRPVLEQNDIPIDLGVGNDESEIWLGDLQFYLIGDRQTMEVEQSTQAGDAFVKHQLWLKVIERLDGQLALTDAFVKLAKVK